MQSDCRSQPLKVLVVTEDRALQRQLSQFLTAVGYRALQASDSHSAMVALEAENPQIVLLESNMAARSNWALELLCGHRLRPAPVTLLLADRPKEQMVERALEAGIDDFLRMPLDFGELLTRLRAAARLHEFDRRVGQQSYTDEQTDLMSRAAIVTWLAQHWADSDRTPPRVACVTVDVDFVARIERSHGSIAAEALLKAVAVELNKAQDGCELVGCLGGDRFCVVLPNLNGKAAGDWAEAARQAIAAAKFKVGDATYQVTASLGVASSETASTPELLVEQAIDALQVAKSSGRNCVVRYDEISDDSQVANEKLLELTTAKDVMTPCTTFLGADEPLGDAIELLGRTHLEAIPVVDADGTLLGICEQEKVETVASSASRGRLTRETMTKEVQCFDEGKSLTAILDFFTRDSRRFAMVVRDRCPVGFVTCDSLATLWQPLTTASFAAEGEYGDATDYLLVPDLCEREST